MQVSFSFKMPSSYCLPNKCRSENADDSTETIVADGINNTEQVNSKRKKPEMDAELSSPQYLQTHVDGRSSSSKAAAADSPEGRKSSYKQKKHNNRDWTVLRPRR